MSTLRQSDNLAFRPAAVALDGERDSALRAADVLALSDERDLWLRRVLVSWSAGLRLGRREGFVAGYAQAERDMARGWREVAGPVARGGPPYAELERRRWMLRGEPRTRQTFGWPHRDDHPGNDAA